MALDEYQRRERSRYLGSSDAAAIVGKDPYKGPIDVWLEKTGQLGPELEDDGRSVRALGQFLEPAVLAWAEHELGLRFATSQMYVAQDGIRCANVDALALDTDEPLLIEAKTSGLLGDPRYFDQWGVAETDDLPPHVLVQVHHQFGVLEEQEALPAFEWAVVPVLLARRGFVLYRVKKDPELVATLKVAATRFWQNHVVPGTVPKGSPPQLEVLKRLTRVPEKRVAVDPRLIVAYLDARDMRLDAEKHEGACYRALVAALGDADGGEGASLIDPSKRYLVTYLETHRKEYTVAASTYRKLNVKEVKTP